ncbi:hypothetical protein A3D66_03105 [Candidatus Kaiserbacteria bacterium RIFCSPHIGHO2_02_FULL_50_9]|nr:MAG: hypothetical protein A3D66_03105 [Candidatus Kaiserbacteria bacterium RIFCSPHIGHO2_02_FULL_50_9]
MTRRQMQNFFLLVMLAACGAFAPGTVTQAQTTGLSPVEIVASPENPTPGAQVLIHLQSASIDLDRSTIIWTINGKRGASGVGVKNTTAVAGVVGTRLLISVAVTEPSGAPVSAAVTLTISTVDVLWQAISYTPPFYQGKALAASDAPVMVTAIPHLVVSSGKEASPGTLIYTWRRNTTVLGNQSGRGRSSVTIDGPKLNDSVRVFVDIATADGAVRGSGAAIIGAAAPEVVLYEDDPLLGIQFNTALQKEFFLSGSESRIVAVPYFMSAKERTSGALRYQWTLNGMPVATEEGKKGSVTLRQTAEGSGTATLALVVQNLKQILQSASRSLTVSFGSKK